MRNFIIGALAILCIILAFLFWKSKATAQTTTLTSTDLVQKIKNVGKLIVTEGHFSEVITYKDAKKYYLDVLTAKKQALVVVNAKAIIAYDLSLIEYVVDKNSKTLTLTYIPEPEIDINPTIEYYDIQQDYLNQFNAKDYNLIRKKVDKQLKEKIEASSLVSNAENRLISELHKIYILTSTMGWQLIYKNEPVNSIETIEKLVL